MNYSRKVQIVAPKKLKFREMIFSREGVLIPTNGRVSSRNRITQMSSNQFCENQDRDEINMFK
ncbi:hypothetical protein A3Q56_00326 [Intoshia linei]|uniref:Uncharacterized protein n=1 Tax=Intoshia linei TaxID=1819745 RepID=A0A177BC46_9BILA|nr:hypothetical protein A3Q56_00326 [Intoshia linei]